MKKTLFLATTLMVCLQLSTWAQSKSSSDVTVHIDGKKVPLDSLMGNLGNQLGGSIASLFRSINVETHGTGFSFNIDDENIDDIASSIESMVENLTKNLEFELNNVKPEDVSDKGKNQSSINGYTGDDLLNEIEREYGSKVEIFESLRLKINNGITSLYVRAKLKNGKVVSKQIDNLERYKERVRE